MRNDTVERRAAIYRDAVALINDDYAKPLTLKSVARAIGASERQLQRAFDEAGGTSFRDVLRSVRMERAGEMLAVGTHTVREIAVAVGHAAPGHFARNFRRHHGVTPAAYRAARRSTLAGHALVGLG